MIVTSISIALPSYKVLVDIPVGGGSASRGSSVLTLEIATMGISRSSCQISALSGEEI